MANKQTHKLNYTYRPIAVGVALTSFARKSAMLEYMCAVESVAPSLSIPTLFF